MSLGLSAAAWAGIGAIGAVGVSAYSANKAGDAQESASNAANQTARDSTAQAIAFQREQSAQARADNEPWRQAGIGALNKLTGAPDFSYTGAELTGDPGYQFGLKEGMKGVTNSATARGGLLSGAALKAASRYNSDYAGTKFNDGFSRALQTDNTNKNRLASLAGVGQVAAGQNASGAMALGQNVGNAYTSLGNSVGQNMLGVGNARASGYLASGNALTNGLNQGISMWNQRNNNGYAANGVGSGYDPYAGYDAAANGGWGIE